MATGGPKQEKFSSRTSFIGGSDARIIMGNDETALVRLWREKRGEAEPEDLSGNLIVQLGVATEALNRIWYERNTGRRIIRDVQRRVKHTAIPWMAATLDGIVEETTEAVFEVQVHAALVILRGGGRRKVHGATPAQHVGHPTYGHRCYQSSLVEENGSRSRFPMARGIFTVLVAAEKKFWRCVQSGEIPTSSMSSRRDPHRGNPHCRHERLEFLGQVRGPLPQYPGCPS